MATIKRGVSSYSYQNLIFDRKMGYRDFIRTIREDLNARKASRLKKNLTSAGHFLYSRSTFPTTN